MTLEFMNNENGTRLLAVYVAQLIKEGVTFTLKRYEAAVAVTLTGGY